MSRERCHPNAYERTRNKQTNKQQTNKRTICELHEPLRCCNLRLNKVKVDYVLCRYSVFRTRHELVEVVGGEHDPIVVLESGTL